MDEFPFLSTFGGSSRAEGHFQQLWGQQEIQAW